MACKRARSILIFNVVKQECDIRVHRLYKWALRAVERWVLSAIPCQQKEKRHGTIGDMIVASSHILSLSPEGATQCVYSSGLTFVSASTNKRHHLRGRPPPRALHFLPGRLCMTAVWAGIFFIGVCFRSNTNDAPISSHFAGFTLCAITSSQCHITTRKRTTGSTRLVAYLY